MKVARLAAALVDTASVDACDGMTVVWMLELRVVDLSAVFANGSEEEGHPWRPWWWRWLPFPASFSLATFLRFHFGRWTPRNDSNPIEAWQRAKLEAEEHDRKKALERTERRIALRAELAFGLLQLRPLTTDASFGPLSRGGIAVD